MAVWIVVNQDRGNFEFALELSQKRNRRRVGPWSDERIVQVVALSLLSQHLVCHPVINHSMQQFQIAPKALRTGKTDIISAAAAQITALRVPIFHILVRARNFEIAFVVIGASTVVPESFTPTQLAARCSRE